MCYAGVDIPDEMKDHIRSNAKRGRKRKRTKALQKQPGEHPSTCKPKPPKKKKKNVASTKNIASSEKVSEVESEAEDDGTL